MSTAKYIDGPDLVQTSLYGYDRSKKVQLNHLRGRPIVVLRSETLDGSKHNKWVVRKGGGKNGEKPDFPSYAHFHHQYTFPKSGEPLSPTFSQSSNDRNSSTVLNFESTVEDQQNVKRLFDKLAVSSPTRPIFSTNLPSSSSSCTNGSNDITILQLNPAFSKTKKNMMSSCCSSLSPSDSSSYMSSQMSKDEEADNQNNASSSFDGDATSNCSRFASTFDGDETRNELDDDLEDNTSGDKIHTCVDEIHCNIFRGSNCSDERTERKVILDWYDDLIQWRHDVLKKKYERFGPPKCHPPPMTHTLIGASRTQKENPFHKIFHEHPFEVEAKEHQRLRFEARRCQNLVPHDLPLPAPHDFIENAKRMEPHLFVEYCYQLTAAAYVDIGLNPPHRRPPIPPPIEPLPKPPSSESIYSSASDFSSDGEYSDDSEDTKKERLRLKKERHRRRELRLQQIFRRRAAESMYNEMNMSENQPDFGI